ncbi:uncharacterized protein LOC9646983 [Selaginella moellendorffii]|uniref:uncharacterized protein LOC9646983 n=1 Tax=Selaginella moellendorffii TaxID=88036 RepID=UPI000D1CC51D|nr:uncharacterized protein LOC9646983 [Selaginella moellendorffii]|eukprot:XP_002981043.2 uncharacterized protein LOC9646983 [Selaginella moellendorffii]
MADVENLNCGDVPRRKKGSPVGWFPRGKKESYLERKIRLLHQEAQGMTTSLDETLLGSRHLSRIEKEKRSAVAAAQEATETRKSALVEASWCRILKAARLPFMSAALELQKAEKKAAEAFNKAAFLGVVLRTNSQNLRGEAPEANAGTPSSRHKVTASLDTAFEVDEEVAAALKCALEQIERTSEPATEAGDHSLEAGDTDHLKDSVRADSNDETTASPLTCLMLDRVRSLQPEQRASLASMVASRGLNALLKEESYEQELNAKNGKAGLGDVLVKHVSRLEAEKAAAATMVAARQDEPETREPLAEMSNAAELEPVKKASRLEMEKQSFAAPRPGSSSSSSQRRKQREQESATSWGGLDFGSSLKRHVSKLEAEQAAWRRAAEDARNK